MKIRLLLATLTLTVLQSSFHLASAQTRDTVSAYLPDSALSARHHSPRPSRLTLGGYGEATYQYNFFSDNFNRYNFPTKYAETKGHGRADLPHAVLMLGYDFGHGWSFGTEVEFEHGGVEAAVEMEADEAGEFEKEIERGGEVALEQFWLQKTFSPKANLRFGHIVVPVGATNNAHLPNQFFGVFRPEGENTIFPCTWHETGISFFGRAGQWHYELQVIPALNSNMFDKASWANNASASAYEFRSANNLALAARVDNYSIPGLRLSLSGYVGNTFNNDLLTYNSSRYADVRGTVFIGAFDFLGRWGRLTVRGNADYGYLGDASAISAFNTSLDNSSNSPYIHTLVGQRAYAVGCEVGYAVAKRFTPFVRIDAYDSYLPATTQANSFLWTARRCYLVGLNYRPIEDIVVKGEFGYRDFSSQYNDEPWVAVGITWAGFFKR